MQISSPFRFFGPPSGMPRLQSEPRLEAEASQRTNNVPPERCDPMADAPWSARVVHALVSAPSSAWGPVSCAVAFHLLDRREDHAHPEVQSGVRTLVTWAAAEGMALGAHGVAEIVFKDGRFGVLCDEHVQWMSTTASCQGLWLAVLTAAGAVGHSHESNGTSVDEPERLASLDNLLPQLVPRLASADPAFAEAAWHAQLAGHDPAFTHGAQASLRRVAGACGALLATGAAVGMTYGLVSGALSWDVSPQVSDAVSSDVSSHALATIDTDAADATPLDGGAPLATALACGVLEAAAAVRAYATLPSEAQSRALQRARDLSAYALLLPELQASDLRRLVLMMDDACGHADVFEVADALKRRLDTRAPWQTPSEIISTLNARDLLHALQTRERRQFRHEAPGSAKALEAALQYAYECGLLSPRADAIQAGRDMRRVERWNAWLSEQDEAVGAGVRALPAPSTYRRPWFPTVPRANDSVLGRPPVDLSAGVALDWPGSLSTHRSLGLRPDSPVSGAWGLSGAMAHDARAQAASSPGVRSVTSALLGPAAGGAVANSRTGARWLGAVTLLTVFGVVGKAVLSRWFPPDVDGEMGESDLDPPVALPVIEHPLHHAPPVHSGPKLVPRDEPLTLAQMLRVIESTERIEASGSSMDRTRRQAQATANRQMEAVLRKQKSLEMPRGVSLPWDAIVEVTYDEFGRSPQTERFSFTLGRKTVTNFTVRDIALGHHYLSEFEIAMGWKRVEQLRVQNPAAQTLLDAIDRDTFRTALSERDRRQLDRWASDERQLETYREFVQEMFTAALANAGGSGWERQGPPGGHPGHPLHPANEASGQGQRRRVGHGAVRLVTFDERILPELLAVSQPAGRAVLLISLKKGTSFLWTPEVEATDAFREFISGFLSVLQLQHMQSPLRWNRFKLRIGEQASLNDQVCMKPRNGRTNGRMNGRISESATSAPHRRGDALYDEVRFSPSFMFVACPDPIRELWQAKVERAHEDRDLLIVTQAWRDAHRKHEVRQMAFTGLKLAGPAMVAMFRRKSVAGIAMSLAYEVGAFIGGISENVDRARAADLEELKRIHRDLSVVESLASLLRIPNVGTLDAAADWILDNWGRVHQASRSLESSMDTWPTVRRLRGQFADYVRAEVKAGKRPGYSADLPAWVVLSRIKSYLNIPTDGTVLEPLASTPGQSPHVDAFLGTGRFQVTSMSELEGLTEGYCVALTYRNGTMFFAGVTSGSGKLLGAATRERQQALPDDRTPKSAHDAEEVLSVDGIARLSQRAFRFHADGHVTAGGIDGYLYVESLRDRMPDASAASSPAEGWPSVPALAQTTAASATSAATPATLTPTPTVVTSRERTPIRRPNHTLLSGRSKRAHDRWDAFVDAWHARNGRTITRFGASMATRTTTASAMTQSPPTPPTATLSTDLVDATSPRTDDVTSSSSVVLCTHWSAPTFRAEFSEITARVARGLLLWHMPQMAQPQQALMLSALKGDAVFRSVTANATNLPGVLGLRQGDCQLLLSLTTGEVLASSADNADNARMRAFVALHMGDRAEAQAPAQDMQVVLGSDAVSLRGDRVIDDLRDQVSDATQRGTTVAHGILRLIRRAANALPAAEAQTLIADVQRVARNATSMASEAVYLNDPVDGPQTAPSLSLAYDIGAAIREFSDEIFLRTPTGATPGDAAAFVERFVDHVRRCRMLSRVGDDTADLVRSGLGDADFAMAMLECGRDLGDGKFGAAAAAVWAQVPGQHYFCERLNAVPQLVALKGVEVVRNVPRGCRILIGVSDNVGDDRGTYDDILSLGQGAAAVVTPVNGTEGAARFELTSMDLSHNDAAIVWSDDGGWHRDGQPVDLWVQSDTPNVFAEPAPPALETGSIAAASFLATLLGHADVNALQSERSGTRQLNLTDTTLRMLGAVETTFDSHAVMDIRFRLILAWSAADQYRPYVSLAVTGKAPPSWVTTGYVDRVVADMFPRRVLGDTPVLQGDVSVTSEPDWQDLYVRHGSARCIKYRDFDTADGALRAAVAYTSVPGALSGDFMPSGVLLRLPPWRHPPEWA